jgi:hypothetical protein
VSEVKNSICLPKALALLVVLAVPSFGWSLSDGRGFSGPNPAPVSIPVALERGIRADRLQEALKGCFAGPRQIQKSGPSSLLQKLAAQLVKGDAQVLQWLMFGASVIENEDYRVIYPLGTIQRSNGDSAKQVLEYGFLEFPEWKFNGYLFKVSPNLEYYSSENVYLHTPALIPVNGAWVGAIPYIQYHSTALDSGYDEYGRFNPNLRILLGVTIQAPAESYSNAVRLWNAESKHATQVTINTVEYVECLQREIQKRAE